MLYRDLSTQEEIDLQYDPVRRVSDPQAFDKIIEQRVEPAEAAARVLRAMKEGKVRATNGQDFSVRAQSVCVHSDTPGALAVAKAVHGALRPARAAE
jgi:lactam utilization protein B